MAFEKGAGVETQARKRDAMPLTWTNEGGNRVQLTARVDAPLTFLDVHTSEEGLALARAIGIRLSRKVSRHAWKLKLPALGKSQHLKMKTDIRSVGIKRDEHTSSMNATRVTPSSVRRNDPLIYSVLYSVFNPTSSHAIPCHPMSSVFLTLA